MSHRVSEIYFLQIARLEESAAKDEATIIGLQSEHDDQMSELNTSMSAALERGSQQWRDERLRLEDHYSNIIAEHVNRQQVNLYFGIAIACRQFSEVSLPASCCFWL